MGLVDTLVTESYSHCHDGVCRFLSQLIQKTILPSQGDLRIMYLSSRPLSLSNYTRKFLSQVNQPPTSNAEGIPSYLPAGPLIGYPGTVAGILHMELITHSVHKFKHQCLQENILAPLLQLGETNHPFWAAFGNTWMDVQAYQAVGVPLSRLGFITKLSSIHILRNVQQSTCAEFSPTTPPGRYSERSFPSFRDPKLLEYFQEGIMDDF
jgi:phosphatidate phosphatase PAH1